MSDLWGPVSKTEWQATPCIVGRPATEADVLAGAAVFFIDGESQAEHIPLPRLALQRMEDDTEVPVVVIQAERGPSGIILGVRYLIGGN